MKVLVCIVVIGLALVITSAFAGIIGKSDEEVQSIANPILDMFLEGMKIGDYTKYSMYFDDTLKEALPEKRFRVVREQIKGQMGDYQSREYLGFLNKGPMTIVLWKGAFDKTEDEVLIKVVLSKRGDKYVITGVWFQ